VEARCGRRHSSRAAGGGSLTKGDDEMRRLRLTIGFACLAGLAGCDQFDPTLPVREAVAAPAPWAAVTAYFNADSDKVEARAHHNGWHDRGGRCWRGNNPHCP